jgi:hypothetical protein
MAFIRIFYIIKRLLEDLEIFEKNQFHALELLGVLGNNQLAGLRMKGKILL